MGTGCPFSAGNGTEWPREAFRVGAFVSDGQERGGMSAGAAGRIACATLGRASFTPNLIFRPPLIARIVPRKLFRRWRYDIFLHVFAGFDEMSQMQHRETRAPGIGHFVSGLFG